MGSLDRETTVVADRTHVSAEVDGEIVVLQVTTGTYFGVDDVGAFIWRRLQEPMTVQDLCSAVVARYDVELADAAEDLDRFLNDLLGAGLIAVI
jgi:hypothetical protein